MHEKRNLFQLHLKLEIPSQNLSISVGAFSFPVCCLDRSTVNTLSKQLPFCQVFIFRLKRHQAHKLNCFCSFSIISLCTHRMMMFSYTRFYFTSWTEPAELINRLNSDGEREMTTNSIFIKFNIGDDGARHFSSSAMKKTFSFCFMQTSFSKLFFTLSADSNWKI